MHQKSQEHKKQIMKVFENTTGIYGFIKGKAGNAIGEISALELPYVEDGD